MSVLTIHDHTRCFANYTYVYPVVSRRSNGVSLGINLNVNNACNWRCIYCQVDNLQRGKPVSIDLLKLEFELDEMLNWIINGDFVDKFAPPHLQRFNDICLSGNGESTLSKDFASVVGIIANLRLKYKLTTCVKTILITNGSEMDKSHVQDGVGLLSKLNGEIWFKIDTVTTLGIEKVNQVHLTLESIRRRLLLSSSCCKTYVQTCYFRVSGVDPHVDEIDAYINFICSVKGKIAGVLLYSTARNPALAEGMEISSVNENFLRNIVLRLKNKGIQAQYYV